jgi:hypothetical protein
MAYTRPKSPTARECHTGRGVVVVPVGGGEVVELRLGAIGRLG